MYYTKNYFTFWNIKLYKLREYQTLAVNSAIDWVRKNTSPVLLELATGAGKSLICAEIALIMRGLSGKKVLCLCPSAELVEQNAEKYALTGEKYSIYSASISKSLIHNVIFATEGTFKSVAEEKGADFSLVIIDEAHRITPTIKKIIEDMQSKNKYLRVIGMTATPYRLGTGYIYEQDESGAKMENAINPFFKRKVYTVGGKYLVENGFLTRPVIGKTGVSGYSVENLSLNKSNTFSSDDLDEAFCGKGTKTSAIVADVIEQANSISAKGVMFFAATVRHAEEIMQSLPAYNSALITGDTKRKERRRIISEFKKKKIKYLVNVSVLTTGFDAEHVDVVAILRPTESASLLSQIIGRGLRLSDGKEICLILDYAGNIDRFYPDGDIFNPQIQSFSDKPNPKGSFLCEECNSINEFSLRPNPEGLDIDSNGYFLDLSGEDRIMIGQSPYPAHFGRRCTHIHSLGHDNFERCGYFWTFKPCQSCDHKNDIAARFCESCNIQLIDPNDKLLFEFAAFKNDLSQLQTDSILSIIRKKPRIGLILWVIETEHRKLEVFFSNRVNKKFYDMVNDKGFKPTTVSYKKQSNSEYFIISDFNRKADTVNDFS